MTSKTMTSNHDRAIGGSAFVELLTLAAPQTARGLTVFPLTAKTDGGSSYITLGEALASGQAYVTEVSAHGSVPELTFVNKGDARVLVLDGEELRGAKQNRVLNTSILVAAQSTIVVPVSCTEHGRWHYERADFADGGLVADRSVRYAMKETVSVSVMAGCGYHGDQGRVWDEVGMLHQRHATVSPTGAMRDAYEAKRVDLDEVVRRFPLIDGQRGVLIVHGEAVIGLDLVSLPEKYALLHDRLLRSYVFEALVSDSDASDDPAIARAFLERVADLEAESFKSPGLGWDARFAGNGVLGSVLVYRDRPVHAAFFNVGGVSGGSGRGPGKRSRRQPRPGSPDVPRSHAEQPRWAVADARARARRRRLGW